MAKKFTITTALPYANGPLHLGHVAGVYIPADIYARYQRAKGEDVVFIGGTDEHGVPISIKAKNEGEVPVGAILIKNGALIARAHNQSISNNDASAHAEIQLIRSAGGKLENYRLTGSTLFVTLEPCAMCYGAMVHSRVERLVFGAYDLKTGVCGSSADLTNGINFKHNINITGGILEQECSKILKTFFKQLR